MPERRYNRPPARPTEKETHCGHERQTVGEIERTSGEVLEDLARRINEEHRSFIGSLRNTLEQGIRVGGLLREAKEHCEHGTWIPWLEEHFEGSVRRAQEYLRLYNHRDELQAKTRDSAHLSISGALKELAAGEDEAPEETPDEEHRGIVGIGAFRFTRTRADEGKREVVYEVQTPSSDTRESTVPVTEQHDDEAVVEQPTHDHEVEVVVRDDHCHMAALRSHMSELFDSYMRLRTRLEAVGGPAPFLESIPTEDLRAVAKRLNESMLYLQAVQGYCTQIADEREERENYLSLDDELAE
jgi:hypothetical protein